jgi:NADPH:quinone reductase
VEVFWLGYWFPRLSETVRRQLVTEIVSPMGEGFLATSSEAHSFPPDDIRTAVKQAGSTGRHVKARPVIGGGASGVGSSRKPIGLMR